MRHIEGNLHPDEPWFTLRAQDFLAPFAVREYASLLRAAAGGLRHGDEAYTGRDKQVVARLLAHAEEAEAVAADMIRFQAEHPDLVKLPD